MKVPYKRNCPNCNNMQYFTTKRGFDIAEKKNSLCASCAKIGKNHPMYGKHHSMQTKKRMRKHMMGNKNPMKRQDIRNKVSKTLMGHSGYSHTENVKKKMSLAKQGKNNPNWRLRGKEYTRWQEYKLDVQKITRHQSLHTLSNFNKRGRAGTKGAYQVDHIVSVKRGFDEGISADVIGNIKNLRCISWEENLQKGNKDI